MSVFILESTAEWDAWLTVLRDPIGKRAILGRLARLEIKGHWGDAKLVGGGVTEMRVDSGPGYRLYCKRKGSVVVVLLSGGDKGSQERDVRRAKEIVAREKI